MGSQKRTILCHWGWIVTHRNLVKILTFCSGVNYQGNDFKTLIDELMVNGSLDGQW